jgi:hypothetical protein
MQQYYRVQCIKLHGCDTRPNASPRPLPPTPSHRRRREAAGIGSTACENRGRPVSDELADGLARSSRADARHASWDERACRRPGLCFRLGSGPETRHGRWPRTASATSPCSGQRIDGSRAVTNASNAITSGCRRVPSVNSTARQARPRCGHGNREPARKPRRRSTRRRSKSKSLLITRNGGSSCNASSKSCFMLRTGTPSVNDRAWYPSDIREPGL